MDLKDFFNAQFFKDLPLWAQIVLSIFTIFLLWFTYLLKNNNFRVLIGNGIRKMFHYVSEKDLLMHHLFYQKKYYLNQLHNINFESNNKTKLFRILLTELIKASIDLPFEHINKTSLRSMSPHELRNSFNDLLFRIIERYEKETLARFVELYGQKKGEEIFKLIYKSEEGFEKYHKNRIEFIFENIERVLLSQAKSMPDSVRTILTQIDIATDMAILDCETAFRELNGRIEIVIN